MPLAFGTRIGPYEILTPLGAGGMGEVYRARDTRLGREVAIKVLPDGLAQNAVALGRFQREAKAVAALSHPGIVALHDAGKENGVHYAVTELLDGETLRVVASQGALPVRRALEIVAQVAEALAAAHEQWIVHRDVKPENIFVTRERRAKLLDFSLAARAGPEPGSGDGAEAQTRSLLTEPGAVMGTVAYMSPEQARGDDVDFRTDQFSLGVVLYELLAGARPFDRPSAAETVAAILRDEPEPLARRAPQTPAPVLWLVDRLLAKDPEGRYASTLDLARDLQTLLVRLSDAGTVSGPGTAAEVPERRTRSALLAVLGAVAASGALFLAGIRLERTRSDSRPPTFRRLTFHQGFVGSARFMPDGQTVVYGAGWDGQVPDVFAVRLDGPEARPLGFPDAGLLAVSRSSQLALSLDVDAPRRFRPFKLRNGPWKVGVVPFSGGAPRALATNGYAADFAPDGSTLAVSRSLPGSGMQLELPIGNVRHRARPGKGIWHLRFSPDGSRVAFLECVPGRRDCNVAVVDRSGAARTLSSDYSETSGLAWSPEGDEVWFGAAADSWRFEVRAVDLHGRERLVLRQLDSVIPQDVDARGRVLVAGLDRRTRVLFKGEGDVAERDLSWFERSAFNVNTRRTRT